MQRDRRAVGEMSRPGGLCRVGCFDGREAGIAHLRQPIDDPVDVLLDRHHHVGEHRRAAGTGDGEEVGEACDGQAEIGLRSARPDVRQRLAAPAGNRMDGHDGAGHRIEAGGEDDHVDIETALVRDDAGGGDRGDRLLPQVHQGDVGPVVGGVVAGIEAGPLGTERVIVRAEGRGGLGILDRRADLLADQVGHQGIAVDIDTLVGPELRQDDDQIAGGPAGLEAFAALGIVQLPAERRSRRQGHAGHRPARLLAVGHAILLERGHALRRCRTVMRRQGEVRCALENGEVRGLGGDQRDRLDARRARADHGDALAGQIDLLVRPAAGEVDFALEVADAVDLRRLGRGEAAARHDVVAAGDRRAIACRQMPALGILVPFRFGDRRAEPDVPSQVVAIGDEAEIAQDLGLGGVLLRPLPRRLQLGVERVAVVRRLDIASRTGIAVPVPGAADIVGGLQCHGREAGLAQAMKQIEAGETGTDDCDIDLLHVLRACCVRHRFLPLGYGGPAGKPDSIRRARQRKNGGGSIALRGERDHASPTVRKAKA